MKHRVLSAALVLTLSATACELATTAAPTPVPDIPAALAQIPLDDDTSDAPAYDRDLFGGGWADTDSDGCDTRSERLAAESSTPINTNKYCTVKSGTWDDPFVAGTQQISDPKQIDVDHIVPAAYGWRHGLWNASEAERERFFNWEPNLWPVSASENRSKSDSGPAEYAPPDPAIHCEYAQTWVATATEFDLSITTADRDSLAVMLTACGSSE